MGSNYEFNSSENEVFSKIGKWLMVVSIGVGIVGILNVLSGIMTKMYVTAGAGVVSLVVSVFLIQSSNAFKRIVQTKGDDIAHVMDALKSLRGYFFIQAASLIIGFISGLAGLA